MDKALVSRDARNRCRTANLILIRCWSHIKDLLVTLKEQADNAASEGGDSGPGDPNDLLNSILSALAGGSEEGTGDTSPVGGSPAPSEATSATGSQRAATAALAAGSADGGSEEQDPEKNEAKASGGEDGEESGEEGDEGPSADDSDPESSQNGDGGLE